MVNNGFKDIYGELLYNVGLILDEQISMCNGNGLIEYKIIKDEISSYCLEEFVDFFFDFFFKWRNCEVEVLSIDFLNFFGFM